MLKISVLRSPTAKLIECLDAARGVGGGAG